MRDLAIAFVFFTRLPIPIRGEIQPQHLSRSSRYYPLVGAVVGLFVGGLCWAAERFFPPLLAATLGVAAGLLMTGAFHEDALGDVADGFGGGFSREQKLAIMKDSRHGTYGVLAMVLALLIRIQAIGMLPPFKLVGALMAAHSLSRVGIVWMLWRLPAARQEGLGAETHRLTWREPTLATIFGLTIGALCMGAGVWPMALGVAAATTIVARLSLKQIGGITGDVLGTAQQLSELFSLLILGAMLGGGLSWRP